MKYFPAQNLDMSSFKYFLALDILQPSTAYISHPNLSFSWNMIHIHFLTPDSTLKRILKDVCRASQWRWIIFVDAADQQMFDIDYVFNKLSLFIGKSWDSEVNLLLGWSKLDHQTSHLLLGFMAEPIGHWKSLEKSGLFENGPFTLDKQNRFRRGSRNKEKLPEKIAQHPLTPWQPTKKIVNLKGPGLWAPVLILLSRARGRYFEHQVFPALIQNI